jgi:hypothetical protein
LSFGDFRHPFLLSLSSFPFSLSLKYVTFFILSASPIFSQANEIIIVLLYYHNFITLTLPFLQNKTSKPRDNLQGP